MWLVVRMAWPLYPIRSILPVTHLGLAFTRCRNGGHGWCVIHLSIIVGLSEP